MSRVYIKFPSEADEVNGFYVLATQSRVDSFRDIFGISEADLQLLDNEGVKYTFAPEHEVIEAYQRVRDLWNRQSRTRIKSIGQKIKRWAQLRFANARS